MTQFVKAFRWQKVTSLSALACCLAVVFVVFLGQQISAELAPATLSRFSPNRLSPAKAAIERSGSPWINLKQGEPIDAEFVGTDSAISRLESGALRPTAIAAVDFNLDGYTDIIGGFSNGGGGVLTFHRANNEAFAPEDPQVLEGIRNGQFPVSFEKETKVTELAIEPDFIVSGRFVKDSPLDLIVASRGSNRIYVFSTDERGGFLPARAIVLDETVTALAGDRFDTTKEFSGLTVGTKANGGELLVFDGSRDLFSSKPQKVELGREISSLILASADGTTVERDLFMLADGEISRIAKIGKGTQNVSRIDLPIRATDFAIGEFIRDRRAKAEIAILGENGSIYYLQNGPLDLRPFTEQEMRAHFAKYGRGRTLVTDSTDEQSSLADNWTVAEEHNLGVFESSRLTAQPLIQKAYITGNATEDLLVTNPANGKVQVIFKEPNYEPNATSYTGATFVEAVDFAGSTAAVLPVRLNVMGQKGIVALENGSFEPTPVMFVPNATFTANKAADGNDGVCNADCSLREAIVAANGAAGTDMVTFSANFTHQLTVGGANENSGAGGDLDITQALTITGNGIGNTIVQAGASVGTGIDKNISINPSFTLPFATSMTGMTIRFGRNLGGFAGDGFGGGFDWEGSGTGTLTVSNLTISDNRTTDGDGGGVTITNSSAGSGNTSFTGITFSGNQPARTGGPSPIGGGIYIGTATHFAFNNLTFSTNNVNGSGGFGSGGGLYAFFPSGAFGTSTITNTSFNGNIAPSNGGGMLMTQSVNYTAPLVFTSNSSGANGGGANISIGTATNTITKATFTGNSASTNGGAIHSAGGFLNVSFSRFAGNTSGGVTGISVASDSVTAQNNWWACNAGPSNPACNTAANTLSGAINFTPWLTLGISAVSTSLVTGQTTTLTSSFLTNSAGGAVSASNLDALFGVSVGWTGGGGGSTISSPQTTIQNSGTATATFSSTQIGAKSASASVDNQTVTVNPINVSQAATTTSITADTPDPSNVGQTVTVSYSVSANSPGGGTPTGNVIVSDGVNSNTCTVAAGSCSVALNTAGNRTLTATYQGDANYTASPASAGASHVVGQVTWTGATNTTFATNTNWNTGLAPGSADTAIIPTGAGNQPTLGSAATVSSLSVASGRILTVNNTLTVSGTLTNNGTIQGTGTIVNNFTNGASGTVAPGLSPGILNITGNYTNSGAFNVEIGGTGGPGVNPNGHDQLLVSGAVTLGGTLNVSLTNGFTPTAGQSFVIVDGATLSGNFVAANVPNIFPNVWSLARNPANGVVTLSVLSPTAANVTVAGRVFAEGRGLRNAIVTITDSSGVTRSTRTSSFGYYSFADVAVGRDYVVSVAGKGYTFQPRVVSVNDNIADLDFTASP